VGSGEAPIWTVVTWRGGSTGAGEEHAASKNRHATTAGAVHLTPRA
jgi:hypothetical protein